MGDVSLETLVSRHRVRRRLWITFRLMSGGRKHCAGPTSCGDSRTGSWQVPSDFKNYVPEFAKRNAAYPGSVMTLSFLSLEVQVNADGATWLMRTRYRMIKQPIMMLPFDGERVNPTR